MAVHRAARIDDTRSLCRLLREGGDINQQIADGVKDKDRKAKGERERKRKKERNGIFFGNFLFFDVRFNGQWVCLESICEGAFFGSLCGQTPLHYAVYYGNTECVRILTGAGANVHIKLVQEYVAGFG